MGSQRNSQFTKRQKEIVIGMILGDAFLQKTGKKSARLRVEHSFKQKEYIFWKYHELQNFAQDRPKLLVRLNPVWKKTYQYLRFQTHAGPLFGKLREQFYPNGKKAIPDIFPQLFRSPLSLAVWYFDDGSYDRKNKAASIYLPKFSSKEKNIIFETLQRNFGLSARFHEKRNGNTALFFSCAETKKLFTIISSFVLPLFLYKLS